MAWPRQSQRLAKKLPFDLEDVTQQVRDATVTSGQAAAPHIMDFFLKSINEMDALKTLLSMFQM